jgi:hypothetical protein
VLCPVGLLSLGRPSAGELVLSVEAHIGLVLVLLRLSLFYSVSFYKKQLSFVIDVSSLFYNEIH